MKQTRLLINSFTKDINDIPIEQKELVPVNRTISPVSIDPTTIDIEDPLYNRDVLYYNNNSLFITISQFEQFEDIATILCGIYAQRYIGLSGVRVTYFNYDNRWYELKINLNTLEPTAEVTGEVEWYSDEAEDLYYCIDNVLYQLANKRTQIGTTLSQQTLQYSGMVKTYYYNNGWKEIRVQALPNEALNDFVVSDETEDDIVVGGIYYYIAGQLYRCNYGYIWVDSNPIERGKDAFNDSYANAITDDGMQLLSNRDLVYLECDPSYDEVHTREIIHDYGHGEIEIDHEPYIYKRVLHPSLDYSELTEDDLKLHCVLDKTKWYYNAPQRKLFQWEPNGTTDFIANPWINTGIKCHRIAVTPAEGGVTINDSKDDWYVVLSMAISTPPSTTDLLSETTFSIWYYSYERRRWLERHALFINQHPHLMWSQQLTDEVIDQVVARNLVFVDVSDANNWVLWKFDYSAFFIEHAFKTQFGNDIDGYGIYERQFQYYRRMMHRYYDINKDDRIDHDDITFIHKHPLKLNQDPTEGQLFYDSLKDKYYLTVKLDPNEVIVAESETYCNDGIVDPQGNPLPVITRNYYNQEGFPIYYDGEDYFDFKELTQDNVFIQHRVMYL